MSTGNWTRVRVQVVGFVVTCCLGCAPPAMVASAPSSLELKRLERDVARDATNAKVAMALADAYRAAGRANDAAPLLERTLVLHPDEATAAFLLGVAYEDLDRFADARRLYRSYIDNPHATKKLREELTHRLSLLQRRELQASVRAMLASEAELVNKPPTPWTIAIFPYRFVGADTAYKPLGRAIAEMLVTDLSQTSRIRVLERATVQRSTRVCTKPQVKWVKSRLLFLCMERVICKTRIVGGALIFGNICLITSWLIKAIQFSI